MAGRARACLCSVTPQSGSPVQGAEKAGGFQFIRPDLPLQGSSLQYRHHRGSIVRSWGLLILLGFNPAGTPEEIASEPGLGSCMDGRERLFTPSRVGPYVPYLACSHTFPSDLTVLGGQQQQERHGMAWRGVAWHGMVNTRVTRSLQRVRDCCYYCCSWLPASLALPPAFPSSCLGLLGGLAGLCPSPPVPGGGTSHIRKHVLARVLVCRAFAQTPEMAMCLRLFHSRGGRQESSTTQPALFSLDAMDPPSPGTRCLRVSGCGVRSATRRVLRSRRASSSSSSAVTRGVGASRRLLGWLPGHREWRNRCRPAVGYG